MTDFFNDYNKFLKAMKDETDAIKKINECLKNELRELEEKARVKNRIRRYFTTEDKQNP